MFDTYRNGIGNIEISDKNLREEISDRIAAGDCLITEHEPTNDDERGWDEFQMELSDGRTVAGTYGWDEEGYRSLRIVEDGERLRMYGVETQDALEEKLQKNLSEQDESLVEKIKEFCDSTTTVDELVDFFDELTDDNDQCSIIENMVMAGWSVTSAISMFEESEYYEYLCALYSEDEGEEV